MKGKTAKETMSIPSLQDKAMAPYSQCSQPQSPHGSMTTFRGQPRICRNQQEKSFFLRTNLGQFIQGESLNCSKSSTSDEGNQKKERNAKEKYKNSSEIGLNNGAAKMSIPGSQQGEDDEVISCQDLLSNTYERPSSDKKASKMAIGVKLGQYDLKDQNLKTQTVENQADDEIQRAFRNSKMRIGGSLAPTETHDLQIDNEDRGQQVDCDELVPQPSSPDAESNTKSPMLLVSNKDNERSHTKILTWNGSRDSHNMSATAQVKPQAFLQNNRA